MKKFDVFLLFTLFLFSLVGCVNPNVSDGCDPLDPEQLQGKTILEQPLGSGFSKMEATNITISFFEKDGETSYDKTYESELTRSAIEIPQDKCYYTVTCRMATGAADYFHIKKVYDTEDINNISQILSGTAFEPTSDRVNFGVFVERFADENKTESYQLDLMGGHIYRQTALGGFEKSVEPLSDDDKYDIILAFFLSPNYEVVSSFGTTHIGDSSALGFDIDSQSVSFEVTLEYAGYKITLDETESMAFYNQQLGGDKCELKRVVQYGKRDLLEENCIKYTCKKSTTAFDGSINVEETVLYIDANDTVITTPSKQGEHIWIDTNICLMATAKDEVYVTYDALSFSFEDILSFMEQKLNETN